MTREERERVQAEWELRWDEFLDWINNVPDFQVKPTPTDADPVEPEKKTQEQEEKNRANVTASPFSSPTSPTGSRL